MATKPQLLSPSWLPPGARESRRDLRLALRMSHARGSHGWVWGAGMPHECVPILAGQTPPGSPKERTSGNTHLEDGDIPTLVSRTLHIVGYRYPLLRDQGILELD